MGSIVISEQRGDWSGEDVAAAATAIRFTDGARYPFHRETARDGECRLLRWEPGSDCGASCDGVCTASGCVAWPAELDAGTLVIGGLHAALTVERDGSSGRYYYAPTDDDLFDAGAAITAEAAGGADVPAFELTATAPAALVTSIESPLELPHDATADVTWTPGDDGAGAGVFLTISSANGGHGEPYDAIIECASADDGAISIPGEYVVALGQLSGLPCIVGHECPPATLTRYREGRTSTAGGDVELWIASERVFYVRHDE